MSDDAKREARINKFEQAVDKRIKVLRSPNAPMDKRVQCAQWLGEAGAPRAIEALAEVYTDTRTSGQLRKATAYALGQYKALEKAVGADKGDSFEASLDQHPEVFEQLVNIAVQGKFGKRKSNGGLWLLTLVLLASFGGLAFFNFTQMTDGDGSSAGAISAPTQTPAPTATEPPVIDGMTATPQPTDIPPTETPTLTPTVAPDDFEPYVRQMTDALDVITRPRGAVELLAQNWQDASQSDRPQGCRDPQPNIPDDVFIPDQYLNAVAGLREAQTQVNITLGLTRQGWETFFRDCGDGTLQQNAEFVISNLIVTLQTTLSSARTSLAPLQALTR